MTTSETRKTPFLWDIRNIDYGRCSLPMWETFLEIVKEAKKLSGTILANPSSLKTENN